MHCGSVQPSSQPRPLFVTQQPPSSTQPTHHRAIGLLLITAFVPALDIDLVYSVKMENTGKPGVISSAQRIKVVMNVRIC